MWMDDGTSRGNLGVFICWSRGCAQRCPKPRLFSNLALLQTKRAVINLERVWIVLSVALDPNFEGLAVTKGLCIHCVAVDD